MKVKMCATVTVFYEVDSEYYGTDDPNEMAIIDQENATVEDILSWGMKTILKIEPVEDSN